MYVISKKEENKMCDENENLQNSREEDSDSEKKKEEEQKEKKRRRRNLFLILILILLLILFLRSCRARDEPQPDDTKKIYEENRSRDMDDGIPQGDGKRLNIAVSETYRISRGNPYFYIGFPKENIYDAVFTLKDAAGKELYRTNYVAAGTNVAIDGTAFLEKGEQEIDCVVSVYERDTGELISDCTSVVLNISYQ